MIAPDSLHKLCYPKVPAQQNPTGSQTSRCRAHCPSETTERVDQSGSMALSISCLRSRMTSKDELERLCKQSWLHFEQVDEACKNDREFVLAVVHQDGRALQWAGQQTKRSTMAFSPTQ
eukprot:3155541-Amphidinium_carterae.1